MALPGLESLGLNGMGITGMAWLVVDVTVTGRRDLP